VKSKRHVFPVSLTFNNFDRVVKTKVLPLLLYKRPVVALCSHAVRPWSAPHWLEESSKNLKKVQISMSRTGKPYENAPVESFFKTLFT